VPRLLVMRHARSGPRPAGGWDFDRPLDEAGRQEARRIGREIAARGWAPDRALASPARRTRETLELLLESLGSRPETEFLPDLYDRMDDDYAGLIRAHGGNAEALMVVGHSPAVRLTALALAASGGAATAAIQDAFPTAALAVIELDGAWAELRPGRGRLAAFLRPQDLGR
jgi:phosphohistidine phosphatase